MAYEVRIEKDSISLAGKRITTFVLKYPRFIHAEFLTHRVFSRNAASNRAIPLKKIIEEIKNDPVIPLKFLKNQPGMQAKEEVDNPALSQITWLGARDEAVKYAEILGNVYNVHKQFVNRVLEPYQWISVVCTSTEYDNFFELRYHEDAQPEIYYLAQLMKEEYNKSVPKKLNDGEWHLPFITEGDVEDAWDIVRNSNAVHPNQEVLNLLLKKSVAKCARVSYNNHDGTKTTFEQDIKLFNRLLESKPLHASPAEHQAMAVGDPNIQSGNFKGWIQYRKLIENQIK